MLTPSNTHRHTQFHLRETTINHWNEKWISPFAGVKTARLLVVFNNLESWALAAVCISSTLVWSVHPTHLTLNDVDNHKSNFQEYLKSYDGFRWTRRWSFFTDTRSISRSMSMIVNQSHMITTTRRHMLWGINYRSLSAIL